MSASGGFRGRAAAALFGAALLVRLPLLARLWPHPQAMLRGDSVTYILPAKNLLAHGVLSGAEAAPFTPDAQRPPGYPLYLAAHFALSDSPRWVAASQVLLDAATAALAGAAGAAAAGTPAGWAAGLIYALDPVCAAHSTLVLSETFFTFFLALSLLLLLRAGPRPGGLGLPALAGLCLGAATSARPVSLYLWLPWTAALAAAWPRGARRRAAAFAAGALLIPALWCARNYSVWGTFSFNPARAADALLWEASAVEAAAGGTTMDAARAELDRRVRERFGPVSSDPDEELRRVTRVARAALLSHPLAAARLLPVSVAKMMLGPGVNLLAEEIWPGEALPEQQSQPYAVAGGGTRAVLARRPALWPLLAWTLALLSAAYALAAAGVWALARRRDWFSLAAIVTPIAGLLAVSAGGWAYYRHRVPLMPLIAALAGAGLGAARERRAAASR